MTTRAPSSTRRSAIAAPMPRAAPITTATLPSTRPAHDRAPPRAAEDRPHLLGDQRRLAVLEAQRPEPDAARRRPRTGRRRSRACRSPGGCISSRRARRAARREIEHDLRHLALDRAGGPGVAARSPQAVGQLLASAAASARGARPRPRRGTGGARSGGPTISSLPTLQLRPMPCCGRPLRRALSMKRGRRRPLLVEHVEVEVLQRGRHDQVAPAAEDARGLRPADRLAAAERDQIGAGGDEAAQVARRAAAGPRRRPGPARRRAARPRPPPRAPAGRPAAATQCTAAVRSPIASAISHASASRTPAPA